MTNPISDAYSAAAAGWERGPARVYERLAARLIAAAEVDVRGATALDVGTGSGAAARVLVEHGARVVATDSAFGMLADRRQARPPAVAGDACALPFRDNVFELAVGAFVVNHLAEPSQALREMGRVCKAGGTVLVSSFSGEAEPMVKAAVDQVTRGFGWSQPSWHSNLKSSCAAGVATVQQLQTALETARLDCPKAWILEVDFGDLEPSVIAAWRLWMPAAAPFVESLHADERAALLAAATAAVQGCPPVVLHVLVGSGVSPGEQGRFSLGAIRRTR